MTTMKFLARFVIFIALAAPCSAHAEERAEDHKQLREVRDAITKALNEMKPADVARYLDADASLTFVDQTLVRNEKEMEAAFAKWFGPESELKSVVFMPVVEHGTIFTGPDTGWCTGRSDDVYTLKDGRTATMVSHWSAFMVKRDGTWKIAMFHAGVDPQNNPLITAVVAGGKRLVLWAGVIALVIGILIGFVGARTFKR